MKTLILSMFKKMKMQVLLLKKPAAKKIAANNHANICFIGFLLYSLFESFSKSVSSIPLPGVWVPGDMSVTAKGVARA